MAIKKPAAAEVAAETDETEAAEVAAETDETEAAEVAAEVAAETDAPLSKTAGQPAASPAPSSTFDPAKGVKKGKVGTFALQTPYTQVNHLSGVRFTQHDETRHVKDYWIVNQMKAKLIAEIIS